MWEASVCVESAIMAQILERTGFHVQDSLWNYYLLGFRVLQPDFLVTLG